jgi:transketolase
MGALMNGLAAHGGFLPFGATFLTFSDYLRPSIRLAAQMGLQVVYVFTHDSIAMGEDGPTHQPVEQLASLRAVPGLIVIRPCDANETTVAWQVALETPDHPVALVLTRQNLPTLDREAFAPAEGLRQGAYLLADPAGAANIEPLLILMASGSEVPLIVEAGRILQQRGIPVRLVSMPSWELFEAQPQAYREAVLPPLLTVRLAVEAGVAQGWEHYTGDRGGVLSVETFGASAPGPVVQREFGFTPDQVCERALALLGREHV